MDDGKRSDASDVACAIALSNRAGGVGGEGGAERRPWRVVQGRGLADFSKVSILRGRSHASKRAHTHMNFIVRAGAPPPHSDNRIQRKKLIVLKYTCFFEGLECGGGAGVGLGGGRGWGGVSGGGAARWRGGAVSGGALNDRQVVRCGATRHCALEQSLTVPPWAQ